jgi:hypothetical protein
MKNKKGQLAVMLVIIIILVGIIFTLGVQGIKYEISNGEHTGYITAVETNGLIWKTDSVYVKSELSSSQEDRYCIIDKEISTKLKQKAVDKEKVTLIYNDWLVRGMENCEPTDSAIVISFK